MNAESGTQEARNGEQRGREEAVEKFYPAVERILNECRGPKFALTLDQITCRAEIPDRRMTEMLMETHLHRFPWPLVAGARGYHIPTSAEQINGYLNSLRSRAVKCFVRARTVRRRCLAAGWQKEGKAFAGQPQQMGLWGERGGMNDE